MILLKILIFKIDTTILQNKMEINYFVILFILISFILFVSGLYYLVNYLCIVHHHEEDVVITDPRDISELSEEEKYPEKVELEIQDSELR